MDYRELVTAALLGTDRRPVEATAATDPATFLLDQAVRLSVAARAGAVLPQLADPVAGPTDHPPWAPPQAQVVMARLLERPQADLLNLWLRAAAEQQVGLTPSHWPALAAYATRSAQLSRPWLAAVLGKAGQWFVAQNPQWAKLAEALRRNQNTSPARAAAASAAAVPHVEPDQLERDPELIFTAADPWPRPLVEVALMLIGSGRLQWRATAYSISLGARLPFEHAPLVRSATQFFAPLDGPPISPIVREAFAALDQTLYLRVEIQQALAAEPLAVAQEGR